MKNGLIEFMRFVFAINIVFFHNAALIGWNSDSLVSVFHNGWIGVEFFFIVTGFFLAKEADKNINQKLNISIGKETVNVLYKKFIRVFPTQLLAFIFAAILLWYVEKPDKITLLKNIINSVPNLFMLEMTGINYYAIQVFGWYLSAMFLSISFLYPLMRKYYDYMTKVFFFIIGVLILGYLFRNYGSIITPTQWIGVSYKGTLRSIAEIMIGCSAYELTKLINKTVFTTLGNFIIMILEIAGYLSFLIYTHLNIGQNIVILLIILTGVSVAITFSNKSTLSVLFKSKIFIVLGELSLPIYLYQSFAMYLTAYLKDIKIIQSSGEIALVLILTVLALSIINLLVLKYINVNKINIFIYGKSGAKS